MNNVILTETIISPSKDAKKDEKSDNLMTIKRKIEKYIVSFNLHKYSNITSDLNKLQGYCDKFQEYNCDSIWIVK